MKKVSVLLSILVIAQGVAHASGEMYGRDIIQGMAEPKGSQFRSEVLYYITGVADTKMIYDAAMLRRSGSNLPHEESAWDKCRSSISREKFAMLVAAKIHALGMHDFGSGPAVMLAAGAVCDPDQEIMSKAVIDGSR